MRHTFLIRLLCPLAALLAFTGAKAQSEVKAQVVSAIGAGNSAALAKYLVPNVDMTLPTASDYYSKAQAEQMLRKFFDEHPPKGLTIEHEGNNRGGDSYYIGNLATANGDFRVTFFLKKSDTGSLVKQLRIETSKTER